MLRSIKCNSVDNSMLNLVSLRRLLQNHNSGTFHSQLSRFRFWRTSCIDIFIHIQIDRGEHREWEQFKGPTLSGYSFQKRQRITEHFTLTPPCLLSDMVRILATRCHSSKMKSLQNMMAVLKVADEDWILSVINNWCILLLEMCSWSHL